jgi:hypothetical protein
VIEDSTAKTSGKRNQTCKMFQVNVLAVFIEGRECSKCHGHGVVYVTTQAVEEIPDA